MVACSEKQRHAAIFNRDKPSALIHSFNLYCAAATPAPTPAEQDGAASATAASKAAAELTAALTDEPFDDWLLDEADWDQIGAVLYAEEQY